jgi:hypothetical protein
MSEQHFNALPSGYQLQEYTLKSVLGHGGFGITYLAADNNLGKDVAVKEYLPTEFAVRRDDSKVQPRSTADNDDYEWGLDRFMKEAQTLGLFRHHNIVPVYRAFKENGTAYMVMEYQKGQSLAELFRKHRADFTEEDLLNLVIPLLDGLAVVHKAGYLHRDLKPGNIFIREDGSPVLLDFGAARNAVGRKSKNLTSIVTPGYAPLEQYFADGNQGPWTDIYAMASILYQAVAGRIPPEAPARVKRDPITPAAEAGRGRFSEAFLEGIDNGLKVEEEQRPQTVEQWRAMLLGQDVPAAPPPTMGRNAASVRSSATMLAGHAPAMAPGGNKTLGGSASMRFPTIAREDAAAHTQRRGMGGGKIAAIIVGVVLLLGASGVGAYIAMNPDHGLFGTGTASTDKGKADTTQISADAEAQRRADEARRKAEKDAEEAKRRGDEDAQRKAEEERKRADEELKRQDEARKRAEQEEAKRKAAEEAKRRAEDERRRRDEEARRGQSDEEEKRRAEEERTRRQEEARRQEEEARRRDEERKEAMRRDEERRRADEERKREDEGRPKGVSCELSVIRAAYPAETDCFFVIRIFKLALETARDGSGASTWSNPRSGATGSIRILSTFSSQDGSMCRRFQQTLTVAGKTQSGTGTACFRNSTWQIVS